ncbi:MAG: hypothetical protein OXH12_01940 [Chloroflexi bacterium]|nr:hypothetical protein [Chloroflexota bacterium]
MSFTFDTMQAVQRLRERGVEEPAAEGMVEMVAEATSPLVTQEFLLTTLRAEMAGLRAELHHTLMVLGLSLAGLVIGTAGVSLAAAALLF